MPKVELTIDQLSHLYDNLLSDILSVAIKADKLERPDPDCVNKAILYHFTQELKNTRNRLRFLTDIVKQFEKIKDKEWQKKLI